MGVDAHEDVQGLLGHLATLKLGHRAAAGVVEHPGFFDVLELVGGAAVALDVALVEAGREMNRFGVGAREHERRDEAAEDGVHLEEEEENSEEPVHDGVRVVIGQLGVPGGDGGHVGTLCSPQRCRAHTDEYGRGYEREPTRVEVGQGVEGVTDDRETNRPLATDLLDHNRRHEHRRQYERRVDDGEGSSAESARVVETRLKIRDSSEGDEVAEEGETDQRKILPNVRLRVVAAAATVTSVVKSH